MGCYSHLLYRLRKIRTRNLALGTPQILWHFGYCDPRHLMKCTPIYREQQLRDFRDPM